MARTLMSGICIAPAYVCDGTMKAAHDGLEAVLGPTMSKLIRSVRWMLNA